MLRSEAARGGEMGACEGKLPVPSAAAAAPGHLLQPAPANTPCPRDAALPTSSSREACPSLPCFGSSSFPEACEESCFCQEARLGGEDSSWHGKRGAVCVAVPLCLPFRLFACFQAVKEPPGPAAVVYPSMGRAPGCMGMSCGGAAPQLPLTVLGDGGSCWEEHPGAGHPGENTPYSMLY